MVDHIRSRHITSTNLSPPRVCGPSYLSFRPRNSFSSVFILIRPNDFFFFQAEDGIRDYKVTGVQTCALPISSYCLTASRAHPEFGRVMVIRSDLESDTRQLTVALAGSTKRGAMVRVSYTLTRSMDQSSFACCSTAQGFAAPTTAADPNVAEWATSDLERRHAVLTTLNYPVSNALEIGVLGRLDEWWHGAANRLGWGYATTPDPVLLYVRAFDPTTRAFRYTVNGRFGSVASAGGGVIVPFQIALQGRLTLGTGTR